MKFGSQSVEFFTKLSMKHCTVTKFNFLTFNLFLDRLDLDQEAVTATIFLPNRRGAKSEGKGIDYRYRFQAPDNDTYEMSWVR